MPIQARKWSDDQRDAMARGVLDMKLAAKEVAARALAGTLVEGLAPFGPVPPTTIRDAASTERRRRVGQARSKLAQDSPSAALQQLWERLVSACDVQLAKLERAANNGKAKPDDLRDMARTIASLGPITRELKRNTPDDTPAPAIPAAAPRKHDATPTTLADHLLADATAEARADHDHTHTHIGTPDPDGPLSDSGDAALATLAATREATEHDGPDCAQADDSAPDQEGMAAAAALRARLGLTPGPTPERMPLS